MYDAIAKALVMFLVPLLIQWIIENFSRNKVKVKKERLDQLSSFLAWPITKKDGLIVQEKFKFFFNYEYTYEEIEFCISRNSPLHALNLLRDYRDFVEFDAENFQIIFREKFDTKSKRNKYNRSMYASYYTGAFIGLIPIYYYDKILGKFGLTSLPFVLFFSVFITLAAIFSLKETQKPGQAEYLINKVTHNNTLRHDAQTCALPNRLRSTQSQPEPSLTQAGRAS